MADKWITVKFCVNKKHCVKKMDLAKEALKKAIDAGVDKGEFKIGDIEIKMDNATSGMM